MNGAGRGGDRHRRERIQPGDVRIRPEDARIRPEDARRAAPRRLPAGDPQATYCAARTAARRPARVAPIVEAEAP